MPFVEFNAASQKQFINITEMYFAAACMYVVASEILILDFHFNVGDAYEAFEAYNKWRIQCLTIFGFFFSLISCCSKAQNVEGDEIENSHLLKQHTKQE